MEGLKKFGAVSSWWKHAYSSYSGKSARCYKRLKGLDSST